MVLKDIVFTILTINLYICNDQKRKIVLYLGFIM